MTRETDPRAKADLVGRILRDLPPFLVGAAAGELALNRIVSRATIFVPKGPGLEILLSGLASVGFFLLALAFLLAIAWLAAASLRLLLRNEGASVERIHGILLLFFLLLGVTSFAQTDPLVTIAFTGLFAAIVLVLLPQLFRGGRSWRAFVAFAAGAYLLHGASVGLSQAAALSGSASLGLWVDVPQRGGEVSTLVATPFLFLSEARGGRGIWRLSPATALVAAIPAALFSFLTTLNYAIIANIALWSVGFTLFLPTLVYAAALWLFTSAALVAWDRGRRQTCFAYLLLVVAGYNLNLSYLYFLAAIALVLLGLEGIGLSSTGQRGSRPQAPADDGVS